MTQERDDECEQLRAALEFYADPENWEQQRGVGGVWPSVAERDAGKRAADALDRAHVERPLEETA